VSFVKPHKRFCICNGTIVIMLAVSFFTWWYGHGWAQVVHNFRPRLQQIAGNFSVGQLIRTLFAPWRRIITYPGASISERFKAWGDNLVSRVVGFVVRLFVLIAAVLVLVVVAAALLIEILLWPLLPIAAVGLIVAGFVI
jgi:hypothetical protein